jgi:hypothetical protein
MTALAAHSHIFTGFGGGFLETIFEMKKQKQKPRQRRRKPNASRLKRQRNKVLDLTAQGKNRAVVAATLGVGVNRLREDPDVCKQKLQGQTNYKTQR